VRLLLARHGNTFAPGDKVVMAGLKNDLPLVAKGIEQAAAVGKYLQKHPVSAVYCGQLQRHTKYAEIAVPALPAQIDPRLNEVDYGDWTGLSNNEIKEKFGADAFVAWEERSEWPANAGWQCSAEAVAKDLKDFVGVLMARHAGESVLVISSNGILRYFLGLVPGAYERAITTKTHKVKTGNLCQLTYKEGSQEEATWQIDFWNESPA
jgi:probable phosphoglycerate mutase